MFSTQVLAQVFIELFDDPQARDQARSYHTYTHINAFNLATTSLRHIGKWYDRLQDIDNGLHNPHSNYYSDPETVGLISRTGATSAVLTSAGREFLDTATLYYNDPQRAEYALNDILYYRGHSLSNRAARLLRTKRGYLNEFLRQCRLTPNAEMILNNDRLLVIAEMLSSFGSALERFLLCDPSHLLAFRDLGEDGFKSLLDGRSVHQGYKTLARRIGGDYTRASVRRRNYLISHLFLELRAQLRASGGQVLPLVIPYPFANLVTPAMAARAAPLFMDDIRVYPEVGGYMVFLEEAAATQAASVTSVQSLTLIPRRGLTRRRQVSSGTGVRRQAVGQYTVDAPLAVEAEDVAEQILRATHGNLVWRVGHTSAETLTLGDGLLPGADIIILDNGGIPVRFIEVKSSRTDPPSSIRLTGAEYARAIRCGLDGVPYDIYVVCFVEGQPAPSVWVGSDFEQAIAGLTIEDLLSMEFGIA